MNSNWQAAPGTVSCKSYWTQWGGRAAEWGAAPWKPKIQGGWSWLASHWATGSDPCIPVLRQGTAELYPNNPASSVPRSQTAASLTSTKAAHFPLVWVNRNPSQSIRNELSFRFWWQGPCCQRRGQQHQTKETIYHLSSSHSKPSSIKTHSCCCLLACWSF